MKPDELDLTTDTLPLHASGVLSEPTNALRTPTDTPYIDQSASSDDEIEIDKNKYYQNLDNDQNDVTLTPGSCEAGGKSSPLKKVFKGPAARTKRRASGGMGGVKVPTSLPGFGASYPSSPNGHQKSLVQPFSTSSPATTPQNQPNSASMDSPTIVEWGEQLTEPVDDPPCPAQSSPHPLRKSNSVGSVHANGPQSANSATNLARRQQVNLCSIDERRQVTQFGFGRLQCTCAGASRSDGVVSDERTSWEFLNVTINRVPSYGFGIAVSGGRDNPHFKSGDPSIVVSDVLRHGPAWGHLLINDRIVSANGVNLENADYASAVQIMRDSDQLNMVIKRRAPMPAVEFEQRTMKFTLTKSKRKDSFGIILGCKYYIKHITNPKLADKEPGLKEGDTVKVINGQNCEAMSFAEAQKMLEKSRERLSLVIERDVVRGTAARWGSQTTLYERLGSVVGAPGASTTAPGPPTDGTGATPRGSPRDSPSLIQAHGQIPAQRGRMVTSEYGQQPGTSGVITGQRHSYGGGSNGGRSPAPAQGNGGSYAPRARTASSNREGAYNDDYGSYVPPRGYGTLQGRPTSPQSQPQSQANDYSTGGESSNLPYATSPMVAGRPPRPHAVETRSVVFTKEAGSVGVRVIGGNEVGIFVSAVQPNSPAQIKGVRPGDKILKINALDLTNVTREEAVMHLLSIKDSVELTLQYRKDEFDRLRNQGLGDNFYIRTHFDCDKPDRQGELTFKRGDIFQVTDTLHGGAVGAWHAVKLTAPPGAQSPPTSGGQQGGANSLAQMNRGVIPNMQRANALAEQQRGSRPQDDDANKLNGRQTGGGFFRRRINLSGAASRRSKSLTKGHWDEVVFASGSVTFPAYERVRLKHPGFLRPVVLFGPLADVARDLLLRDFPLRFASPQAENQGNIDTNGNANSGNCGLNSGIVRLSGIKEVMNKNKHCILDVTPASVEKLQYAQYCPVVIYVGVESRSRLRELRQSRGLPGKLPMSTKKLLEQGTKIQKHYQHLFTATLDATKEDRWFEALMDLVSHLQGDYASDVPCSPKHQTAASEYSGYGTLGRQPNNVQRQGVVNVAGHDPMTASTSALGHYGTLPAQHGHQARVRHQLQQHQQAVQAEQIGQTPAPRVTSEWLAQSATYAAQNDIAHVATLRRNRVPVVPVAPCQPGTRQRIRVPPVPPPRWAHKAPDAGEMMDCYTTGSMWRSWAPGSGAGAGTRQDGTMSDSEQIGAHQWNATTGATGRSVSARAPPPPAESHLDAQYAGVRAALERRLAQAGDHAERAQAGQHVGQVQGDAQQQNKGYYNVKQVLAEQHDDDDIEADQRDHGGGPAQGQQAHVPRVPSPSGGGRQAHSQGRPFASAFAAATATVSVQNEDSNGRQATMSSPAGTPQQQQQTQNQHQPQVVYGSVRAAMAKPPTHVASSQQPQSQSGSGGEGGRGGNGAAASFAFPPPPATQAYARPLPARTQVPPPAPPSRLPQPPMAGSSQAPYATSGSMQTHHNPGATIVRVSSAEESSPSPARDMLNNNNNGSGMGAPPVDGEDISVSASASQSDEHSSVASAGGAPRQGLLNGHSQPGDITPIANGPPSNGTNQIRITSADQHDTDDAESSEHSSGTEKAVVAHCSGLFDHQGGELASDATGVSIRIPPGALPQGEPTRIYFKVCRDASALAPPLDADKGETLLSPLVMCGPQGLSFQRPVELRLPHSASGVNSDQWSFALKSASGADRGAQWKQVSLGDDGSTGRLNENFVSVMIDHF